MSIAERLGEIDLSTVSTEKGAPKGMASLQTDNFAVLLVQGLESSDANILNVRVPLRVWVFHLTTVDVLFQSPKWNTNFYFKFVKS